MAMLLDSPAIVTMRDKDGRTVSTMKVNEVRIHSLGEKTFDSSWCKYGATRR